MRRLQLVAHGEPSDVIELNTVSEPALGQQEDVLISYASPMPGDWLGQTAANSTMGQYIIAPAKLAGVTTLNVVRREEAAPPRPECAPGWRPPAHWSPPQTELVTPAN